MASVEQVLYFSNLKQNLYSRMLIVESPNHLFGTQAFCGLATSF